MDFCRYSKSGPKSRKYFQKVGKLKVVPRVTVRGMRVPKSVGDVKDHPKIKFAYLFLGKYRWRELTHDDFGPQPPTTSQ